MSEKCVHSTRLKEYFKTENSETIGKNVAIILRFFPLQEFVENLFKFVNCAKINEISKHCSDEIKKKLQDEFFLRYPEIQKSLVEKPVQKIESKTQPEDSAFLQLVKSEGQENYVSAEKIKELSSATGILGKLRILSFLPGNYPDSWDQELLKELPEQAEMQMEILLQLLKNKKTKFVLENFDEIFTKIEARRIEQRIQTETNPKTKKDLQSILNSIFE